MIKKKMAQFICKDTWTVIFSFLKKGQSENGSIIHDDYVHPYAYINKITVAIYFGIECDQYCIRSYYKGLSKSTWRRNAIDNRYRSPGNEINLSNIGIFIEQMQYAMTLSDIDRKRSYGNLHNKILDLIKNYKECYEAVEFSDRQTTILVYYLHKIGYEIEYSYFAKHIKLGDIINAQSIINKYPKSGIINTLVLHCMDYPVIQPGLEQNIHKTTLDIIVRRFSWTKKENRKRYNAILKASRRPVSVYNLVIWVSFTIICFPVIIVCLPAFILAPCGQVGACIGIGISAMFWVIVGGILLMLHAQHVI